MLRLARSLFTQLRPRSPLTRAQRQKAVEEMAEYFKSSKIDSQRIRNLRDFFTKHRHISEPPVPPRVSTLVTYQHMYQVSEDFGWAEREEIPVEGRDYLVAESLYSDLVLGGIARLQGDLGDQFRRRTPEETEVDEVQYGGRTYWFKQTSGDLLICAKSAGVEETIFAVSELKAHPLLQSDAKAMESLQQGYFPVVNIVAAQEGGLLALVLDFQHYEYG